MWYLIVSIPSLSPVLTLVHFVAYSTFATSFGYGILIWNQSKLYIRNITFYWKNVSHIKVLYGLLNVLNVKYYCIFNRVYINKANERVIATFIYSKINTLFLL